MNSNTGNIDAVKLMTVHGAKGLEAPIVFVADTGPIKSPADQFKSSAHWPASTQSPTTIMLSCKKSAMSHSALALISQINQADNESLNLLYVALTRAKQVLLISGVQSKGNTQGSWHQLICNSLERDADEVTISEPISKPELPGTNDPTPIRHEIQVDPDIFQPIAPLIHSKISSDSNSTDSIQQGTLVHKCLEILSISPKLDDRALLNRIQSETNIELSIEELQPIKTEAITCVTHVNTHDIFQLNSGQRALNEVTIAYTKDNEHTINVIDRLIISEQLIWIIDYKTDKKALSSNLEQHIATYIPQMRRYFTAIKSLYPDLSVRCSILFTKLPRIVDIDNSHFSDKLTCH